MQAIFFMKKERSHIKMTCRVFISLIGYDSLWKTQVGIDMVAFEFIHLFIFFNKYLLQINLCSRHLRI